jgi:GAF domain-containing protein
VYKLVEDRDELCVLMREGENIVAMVLHTGSTARMDSLDHAAGSTAARIRELGLRSGVGALIVVDGRLWGAVVAGSFRCEPLPADTEERLAEFADLVAIATAQARSELTASGDQQAALRRVAILVAHGETSAEGVLRSGGGIGALPGRGASPPQPSYRSVACSPPPPPRRRPPSTACTRVRLSGILACSKSAM